MWCTASRIRRFMRFLATARLSIFVETINANRRNPLCFLYIRSIPSPRILVPDRSKISISCEGSLFGLGSMLHRQLFPSGQSSPFQYQSAFLRLHPFTEPVNTNSFYFFRLIGTLRHNNSIQENVPVVHPPTKPGFLEQILQRKPGFIALPALSPAL